MLELSYYPNPNSNTVQFAVPKFEEITEFKVIKWFPDKDPIKETHHQLPVITTTLEEDQYIHLTFNSQDNHFFVIFYRSSHDIKLMIKNDETNVYLLVNPKDMHNEK